MHRATTELVIRSFVFLPIRSSEAGLVPLLAIVASAAVVPILDVKTTRETDVLVREILCDIRELGVANSGNVMSRATGNVRDNVRSDCRGNIVTTRRIATTTTTGAIAATATS